VLSQICQTPHKKTRAKKKKTNNSQFKPNISFLTHTPATTHFFPDTGPNPNQHFLVVLPEQFLIYIL